MNKKIKLSAFVLAALLIFILDQNFHWSDQLRNTEQLMFLKELVQKQRRLAVLIYIGLTVAGSVILALPGVTFAIVAGILFGPLEGTLWCVVATTVGAGLAFLTGRFFLKDSLKPLVQKNKYLKKWLFDEAGKNDLLVLMVTRLVPLFPYNLQNFAYGITDIAFGKYMLYSFFFMIPGTAMYTIGTAGLVSAQNRLLYLGIAALLAALVIAAGLYFRRKYLEDDHRS